MMMVHTFNPSTQKPETGDLWVQGLPSLQSEFQDTQGYTEKPRLQKQTNKKPKNSSFPSYFFDI